MSGSEAMDQPDRKPVHCIGWCDVHRCEKVDCFDRHHERPKGTK